MTKTPDQDTELRALDATLSAYGRDMTRWPTGYADRFRPLVDGRAEARRLMAEAAALDRLLDEAGSETTGPTAALADRILAALPVQAPADRVIVALPSPGLAKPRQSTVRSTAPSRRAAAATGSLLAASLLIGLISGALVGQSPLFEDVTQRLGVAQLITGDAGLGADEEDVL